MGNPVTDTHAYFIHQYSKHNVQKQNGKREKNIDQRDEGRVGVVGGSGGEINFGMSGGANNFFFFFFLSFFF